MKIFLFLVLLHVSFLHASDINTKINQKQSSLESQSRAQQDISKKLESVANDILSEDKKLQSIIDEIENLEKHIEANKNIVKDKESNLEDLAKKNITLMETKRELEDKIIKIIAEDFAYYLVSDQNYLDNSEAILVDEVLEKMGVIIKKELSKLTADYETINKKIDTQNNQIVDLKSSIEDLKNKKIKQSKLKKNKEILIAQLDIKRKEYKKRLQNIEVERNEIQATLKKLKIVQANEEAERKRAEEARTAYNNTNLNDTLTVRQIGSSYQDSSVKRYSGTKTIAPLDSFTVKRGFGDYVDPVYNIKIFNESVILSSKTQNAKVKNVLDGKVVYAKNSAVLDNVVIVENSYGIHTIYAHLTQIAPTIKVGMKIKKGYILGRVMQDLSFEVTQKNYHINPLELIANN